MKMDKTIMKINEHERKSVGKRDGRGQGQRKPTQQLKDTFNKIKNRKHMENHKVTNIKLLCFFKGDQNRRIIRQQSETCDGLRFWLGHRLGPKPAGIRGAGIRIAFQGYLHFEASYVAKAKEKVSITKQVCHCGNEVRSIKCSPMTELSKFYQSKQNKNKPNPTKLNQRTP